MISNKTRPELTLLPGGRDFPFATETLDDIIEALVASRTECSMRLVDEAIADAGQQGFGYTVECLLRTRKTLRSEKPYKLDEETSKCLKQRQNSRSIPPCGTPDWQILSHIEWNVKNMI